MPNGTKANGFAGNGAVHGAMEDGDYEKLKGRVNPVFVSEENPGSSALYKSEDPKAAEKKTYDTRI